MKVKRKGAYEYDSLGWHQNHSSLVIAMAAEHEILERGSCEDFIRAHDNKWDFMLRTKVPRSSRLVMVMEDGSEVLQQNICRYYPSKEGGRLIKIMPPLEKKNTKYWMNDELDALVTNTATEHNKAIKKGFEEKKIEFHEAICNPLFLPLMERRLSIDSEWNVKTCNDINEFEWDIDYDYYIQGARKLIDELCEDDT